MKNENQKREWKTILFSIIVCSLGIIMIYNFLQINFNSNKGEGLEFPVDNDKHNKTLLTPITGSPIPITNSPSASSPSPSFLTLFSSETEVAGNFASFGEAASTIVNDICEETGRNVYNYECAFYVGLICTSTYQMVDFPTIYNFDGELPLYATSQTNHSTIIKIANRWNRALTNFGNGTSILLASTGKKNGGADMHPANPMGCKLGGFSGSSFQTCMDWTSNCNPYTFTEGRSALKSMEWINWNGNVRSCGSLDDSNRVPLCLCVPTVKK